MTGKKCTNIQNARAQPAFLLINLCLATFLWASRRRGLQKLPIKNDAEEYNFSLFP